MTLVVITIVLRRGRLRCLLLGDMPEQLTSKESFTRAVLCVRAFLPVMLLARPDIVESILRNVLEPPGTWQRLSLLFVVASIGEELMFRGVLYEYWTRSSGASRGCVLTALTFLSMHGTYIAGALFTPAAIA